MTAFENLVVLYAVIVAVNSLLAAALWARSRTTLYRNVFLLWASSLVGFFAQGALDQNDLAITLGFAFVFPVNLSLAGLVARISEQSLPWKVFLLLLLLALSLSGGLYLAQSSFTLVALPVACAVAAPSLFVSLRALMRHSDALSFTGKALTLTSLLFVAHNLDFPFLRDQPELSALGLTIAIAIVFGLSVFAPAVVLEIVTEQQARVATEMEVAARLQKDILPRQPSVEGLEIECFMRPADEVGGDYYDVVTLGEKGWILLGDVTGHGLSAGLVMLMAQSTISSILHTSKDISPRKLNYLANRVLYRNLQRLGEDKIMTIVSICFDRDTGEFTLSGSHDDLYVFRAETREIEVLEIVDFPLGLGFIDELGLDDFQERSLHMEPGDLLFIGTDGVTEAARGGVYQNGLYEAERLKRLLGEHGDAPLPTIRAKLLEELMHFSEGEIHDDVTFILLRTLPARDIDTR